MALRNMGLRNWARGGAPEAVLASLLFLCDVMGTATRVEGVGALACSAVLCAGAAATRRWPATAVIVVAAGLVIQQLVVGPDDASLGSFASIVVVLSLASAGRRRLLASALAVFVALSAWQVLSRWGVDPAGSARTLALWVVLLAMATAIGLSVRGARRAGEADMRETMARHRRQLAIDLHDNLSHELAMIVMTVEQSRLNGHVTPAELDTIGRTARRGSRYLREIMTMLQVDDDQPSSSPMVDLASSLRQCQSDLERGGFQVVVHGTVPPELEATIGDVLGKLAREGTNNMLRHADRSEPCSFLLVTSPEAVELVMSNAVPAGVTQGSGLGLDGMRMRVESIGGHLLVRSSPRLWTVRASVPTD